MNRNIFYKELLPRPRETERRLPRSKAGTDAEGIAALEQK
jgi:hypothetical protein